MIPIKTPIILDFVNGSFFNINEANRIVKKDAFALRIEASPPETVCCPYVIKRNGNTLFKIPIIKKLKINKNDNFNFILLRTIYKIKIIEAKLTLKYTIINGLI